MNDAERLQELFRDASGRYFHKVIEEIAMAFMEKLDRIEDRLEDLQARSPYQRFDPKPPEDRS